MEPRPDIIPFVHFEQKKIDPPARAKLSNRASQQLRRPRLHNLKRLLKLLAAGLEKTRTQLESRK